MLSWLAMPELMHVGSLMVDDVEATVRTARELGAKIVIEKMVVPGGTFAILVDPTGAAFGIWQVQKA